METPKELQKKYSYSQADFLELARLINKCFKVDQADFVTFDPTMDATFLAGFDALISEAELMSTDEQIRDEQALRTSEVEEVMRQCRNTSQAFKHFIEQTFPKKPQIWNIFGYNDYEKARKSQAKMIVFMRTLFNVAKNYQQELLAAGTPQGQIDSLKVAGDSLIKVNDDQELLKKQRLIKTHARITIDIDVTFEEINFIKEVLMHGLGVKEISLILEKSEDLQNEFVGEIEFETVDQIVLKQLKNIESNTYNPSLSPMRISG